MLGTIGVRSFEELIGHIPAEVRAKKLDLRPGLSELELTQHVTALAKRTNRLPSKSLFSAAVHIEGMCRPRSVRLCHAQNSLLHIRRISQR